MATLVAQGGMSALRNLGQHENAYAEGDRGYMVLDMRTGIAADVAQGLATAISDMGVSGHKVTTRGKQVRIDFKKSIAPLAIIAAAIAVSIVLVMLIVAWKLYKTSPAAVSIGFIIVILVIIAVAGLVAYMYFRGNERLKI